MNPTMEKTLSTQATDWREGRPLRAWELKQQGWNQRQIANALGVTPRGPSEPEDEAGTPGWDRRPQEANASRRAIPPESEDQRARLPGLLARGAPAYGFPGE